MLALSSHSGLSTPLSSCLLVPALLSCFFVPALSSHPKLPTLSSFYPYVSILLSHLPVPTLLSRPLVIALLFPPVPALLSFSVPALLSSLVPASASCFVFGPAPTWFIFSVVRISKQTLSDKFCGHRSTRPSSLKPLCPFSILSPLPEKSDYKRLFDTTFINSYLLTANHAAKEVDLSYGECECPA